MKRTKRTLVAIVAMMAIVCMSLVGCGPKAAPADQSVSALFELYAKNNVAPMQELLGFESEEAVYNAFYEDDVELDFVAEMKNMIESAGIELAEEDVQAFTDSVLGMVDRVSATAEITAEEGDVTTVTLKVNGYTTEDMMNVIVDALTSMQESITEEDAIAIAEGNEELVKQYMKQYFQDIVSGFNAMQPVTEPVEVVVECKQQLVDVNGKEQAEWMPTDLEQFSADVNAAAFH